MFETGGESDTKFLDSMYVSRYRTLAMRFLVGYPQLSATFRSVPDGQEAYPEPVGLSVPVESDVRFSIDGTTMVDSYQ